MLTRASVRLFSTKSLSVVNNVAQQQFQVSLKGEDAVLKYQSNGKSFTITHTEVPPIFQGKGVGGLLAQTAFDHAYKNKLDVTCHCDFAAKYFERNQDKYKGLNVKIELNDD